MSNEELANDQTFLGWLRTGIACIGLGFVVAKVALIAQPNASALDKDLYAVVGIVIVLCGGTLVVVGYLQYKAVLGADDGKPRPRWPLTITVTAVAGSLLLSVLIAVSTQEVALCARWLRSGRGRAD